MEANNNGWHVDKSINLSGVVIAIGMLAGFILWFSDINSILTKHTAQIEQLQQERVETNNRLDKIDNKIDKLIEMHMNSKK